MKIETFEKVARHAWPALVELDTDVGVLRCARGVSRRANSLIPQLGADKNVNAVAAMAESFYHGCGLPAVVRLLDLPGESAAELAALDRELALQQFEFQAQTQVLARSLGGQSLNAGNGELQVRAASLEDWLCCWHEFAGQPAAHFQTHRAMLQRIKGRTFFAVGDLDDSSGDSGAVSCGFGVVSQAVLAIYGIATAAQRRGQGFASAMMAEIINWGMTAGAASAFLQVESANQSALRLYQELGFENFYCYWYRVKPVDSGGDSQ